MSRQIVIVGGPHTGKTTLAGRLAEELGIENVRHSTDDLIGLGWSEASSAASQWFSDQGDWVIEGVTTARALRKWLAANPEQPFGAEVLVLNEAFTPLLKGQQSMTKGVHTVFREIEGELQRRGARIQKLKSANDAIDLFREQEQRGLKKMPDDNGQGADPTQAFQNRLNKLNGDAMAFATQLFDENYRLREDKRTLTGQLTELQAKVPVDGAIVLTGDDAKVYEAYKALGTPKELKDRIDAYPTLEDENKGLKLRDSLREVAEVGFGGSKLKFSILEDRVKAAGGNISFLVKEEGRDKRKVAYVKEGDKETPLEQYAQKNWADYLPSLKAEQAKRTGSANGGEGNGQPAKFDMNSMIRQQAGYAS